MALHMELVCEDLRSFLQMKLPAQIESVAAEAASLGMPPCAPLSVPQPSQYFIGEESIYRALQPPSVFLIPARAQRAMGASEFNTVLHQTLRFQIMLLVEGTDHEAVVRACMRLAQAVDNALTDQDVTPVGVGSRSTKARIPTIDLSNVLVAQSGSVFRGRVFLEVQVLHWDQLPVAA